MCRPEEWIRLIRRAGIPAWRLGEDVVEVIGPDVSGPEVDDTSWHDLILPALMSNAGSLQAWALGIDGHDDAYRVEDRRAREAIEFIRGPWYDGDRYGVALRRSRSPGGKADFRRDAHAAMAAAAGAGRQLAVVLVGVRGFDLVRDGVGHLAADGVFEAIARRLSLAVGDAGVHRLDSECLALALPVGPDEGIAAITAIVERAFGTPVGIDGRRYMLAGRAGFSLFPADAGTLEDLLRIASLALTDAMRARDGAAVRGDAAALARSRQDMMLAGEIAQGIATRQFAFELQPIIDLRSMSVVSAEALARWHHPDLGRVPPSRFVPIAERQDLMINCTIAMLQRLGRELSAAALGPAKIAINVSPGDFTWAKVGRLVDAVKDQALFPLDRLVLEITETSMMQTTDAEAVRIVNALRASGVSVAIDDFGTGYSSFGSLNRLPIDILKVDRSLAQDVHARPDRQRLLAAIASMARLLDMTTVVEGLESEDEVKTVREIGYDRVQGYVFGKPMTAERFADFRRTHRAPPQV